MASGAADDPVRRFELRALELSVLFGVPHDIAAEAATQELIDGNTIVVTEQGGSDSAIVLRFTRSDGSVVALRSLARPTASGRRPFRRLLGRLGRRSALRLNG
jgi:hypothetical protein